MGAWKNLKKEAAKFDDQIIQPAIQTVEKIVENPVALATIALNVFAPGVGTLIGEAIGLSGAAATFVGNVAVNTAINGGDVKSAIVSAAVPVVGSELASVATTAFTDLGMGDTLAKAAGTATAKAVVAEVTGQDPAQAFLTSAVGSGVKELTANIDALKDAPKAVQAATNAGLTAALTGGDPLAAATKAGINAGIASLKSEMKAAPPTPEPQKVAEATVPQSFAPEQLVAQQEPPTQTVSATETDNGLSTIYPPLPAEDTAGTPVQLKDEVKAEGLPALIEEDKTPAAEAQAEKPTTVDEVKPPVVEPPVVEPPVVEPQATDIPQEPVPTSVGGINVFSDLTPEQLDALKFYQTGEVPPSAEPPPEITAAPAAPAAPAVDQTMYPVQDFGASANQNMDSFQQALQNIYDNGGTSSQWMPNDDGTKTMVHDDGSTVTIDENNDIINVTPATDMAPTAPTPVPKPAAPATVAPSTTVAAPTTTSPNQKMIDSALLGLLGAGAASAVSGATSQTPEQEAARKILKMDWNQQNVNPLQGGIAYGQQYFNPQFSEVQAAQGGLMALAGGGMLGSYSDGGRLLRGPGDGMSDNIPASIANKQPARLADGEFVVPADVVSHLGNGSTEAGSRVLYEMMNRVRKARTGNPKQGKQINPNKFMPK